MRSYRAGLVPAAILLALVPAAIAAQEPPPLSLDQRMTLRCSAAFALVAERQGRGDPEALRYPPLAERGREYFVRAAAAVMDEAQLDRARINAALTREARDLIDQNTLGAIMPICLRALEDAGL